MVQKKVDFSILKIIMLGEKNVGLTTFFERHCNGNLYFTDFMNTLGFHVSIKGYNNENSILFQVWHLSNEPRFYSILPMYFVGSQGCIIMFDV